MVTISSTGSGRGPALLSNGTVEMLASGVRNSQLNDLLNVVLLVEEVWCIQARSASVSACGGATRRVSDSALTLTTGFCTL